MTLPWIDQLGDWNPQLFRELKGRLQPRNLIIAVAISLAGQLLLLLGFLTQLPSDDFYNITHHRYCTGRDWQTYSGATCVRLAGKVLINWSLWWQDVFLWLSLIGFFALLVVGTYMLIHDLAQEDRRGTLNFVRLTPQSTESILGGKMLGVPILLYLVAGLAVPLHLYSALVSQIPIKAILGVYAVALTSCLFFYSAALLLSFATKWLGGFQAWLGSGVVFLFLMGMIQPMGAHTTRTAIDWLCLFSPLTVIRYALKSTTLSMLVPSYQLETLPNWQWFNIPFTQSGVGLVSATLLNYGLWTYWIWQSLKRSFRSPNATILSKQQSYLLTACFEVVILGFSVQGFQHSLEVLASRRQEELLINFGILSLANFFLLLGLIVVLSPHRQALQDWARYNQLKIHPEKLKMKQSSSSNSSWGNLKSSVIPDLIWGENSPALVAIALNFVIITLPLVPWILLRSADESDKINTLISLPYFATLVLIYAVITQLILFMKTPNRMFWAAGVISAVILLPYVIFAVLSMSPENHTGLWLFSAFPLFATYYSPAPITAWLAILGQWSILGILSFQLRRQLRTAGESASKAMLQSARVEG